MSSHFKFTKNIGIMGFINVLMALKGIILLPILTKSLSVENFGIWSQIMVSLSLITPIAVLGLPYALIRFLPAEKERKEIQEGIYSVLALVFIFTLVIAALLMFLAGPIGDFLQSPPNFIKLLGLVIIFECLNLVLLNVVIAFQKINRYFYLTIFSIFGELGLIAGVIILGYGLWGAIISFLAIRIIVFLVLFNFILKEKGIKVPTFQRIKEYLAFGLPSITSSISYWIIAASDRYLIGAFLGVVFVGYYSPAYSIGNLINFFIYSFVSILPATLSKFFDENKIEEVRKYLKYSLKYFLMIAIPSVFGLSILSRQLLTIFSTPEIASNSYYITPFVVVSILLYGTYVIFGQVFVLFKKTKISGTIWMAAALLNLGLNFIFIPWFGILGAAITTLLSYTFASSLTWYYSSRKFLFEIDWKFIMKSVFASAIMSLAILWFNPMGLLNTVMAIILGVLLYGILIFLFKGFKTKEIEFLKGLFRKT